MYPPGGWDAHKNSGVSKGGLSPLWPLWRGFQGGTQFRKGPPLAGFLPPFFPPSERMGPPEGVPPEGVSPVPPEGRFPRPPKWSLSRPPEGVSPAGARL